MNRQQIFKLLTGVAILLSAAAIIAAARGDLWLDEVTSLSLAGKARSFLEIFTIFHYDNNHPLNTLFLYLAGNQNNFFIYRLLAVFSGIGSILLIGYVARRDWGWMEALCSVVLAGTSYPLLLYFSEARGYAPEVFFGLAAYAILRVNLRDYSTLRLVLFWLTSILGILSHATFIMLTVSFVVWNLAYEIQNNATLRKKAGWLIAHHLPPLAFFGCWYLFFLKNMIIDGGPVYSTWMVIGQACALLLGLSDTSGFHDAAVILVLAVVAAGAISLHNKRDIKWIFFPTIIVFAPALMLLINHPLHLYFRYFFVCFPFFILLLAYLLCDWYRSPAISLRLLSFIAIALFLIGQAPRDYLLLKLGRGEYAAALEYIVNNSPKDVIVRVGSDHDFRNRTLFNFYSTRVAAGDKLCYIEQSQWANNHPDWIIRHSQEINYDPGDNLLIKGIGKYHLEGTYGFSGYSGFSWFLFRSEDLPSRWLPRPSGGNR
jgi:hypothetical protein